MGTQKASVGAPSTRRGASPLVWIICGVMCATASFVLMSFVPLDGSLPVRLVRYGALLLTPVGLYMIGVAVVLLVGRKEGSPREP